MNRATDKYLDQVRAIVLEHTINQPVAVYFFGSRARGKYHTDSDVDVAIEPLGPLPPAFFSNLREALEESTVPYRVDVVNLAETSDEFRDQVKAQALVWQS